MQPRAKYCNLVAVIALAAALSACADSDASWFPKPFDLFGRKVGYTYADLGETRKDRAITANDLIDANGACPAVAAPPQVSPPPGGSAIPAAADPQFAAPIGLGMSECDVVARLGQPTAINLGTNPNGERAAILTYRSGSRPGVYRFVGGRLNEMDSVDVPPPPPEPAKKKTKKTKKPVKNKDAT